MTDDSTQEQLVSALTTLVAIERDRLLGHSSDELHVTPREALLEADDALLAAGEDPEEVIWSDDRERLGLPAPESAED